MTSYCDVKEVTLRRVKKHGFEEIKPKSKHEIIRYKGPSTLVLYKTGRLLIQGRNKEETAKLIEFLGIVEKFTGVAVGTDETLKGDTFGGIVVAGFKADDEIRCELKQLGVKDSKELDKPTIVNLAIQLIEKYPKNFHVINIFPKDYNRINKRMNVTEILNDLHLKCYKKLSKDAIHIVDEYPGCNVGDIKEKKAESKYVEVAAASIIARYHALKQIRELEQQAGFFIPFGSSHVESGLLEIKKKTLNPEDYVKMNFKNVIQFFD